METPDFLATVSLAQEDNQPFANVVTYSVDEQMEHFSDTNQKDCNEILMDTNIPEPNIGLLPLQQDSFIKIEQSEITTNEATDDENVAVEALRQLGTLQNSSGEAEKQNTESSNACDICSASFSSFKLLKSHTKMCKARTFTCMICNEGFTRRADFNNHLVCHVSSRPHACRICGALFIYSQELVKHMATHKTPATMSSTSQYQCKLCGKNFSRPSSLTNHVKIHNYQPGRAIITEKYSGTNELADVLIGNDAEMQEVQRNLPSITSVTSISSVNQVSDQVNINWNFNGSENNGDNVNYFDLSSNLLDDDIDKVVVIIDDDDEDDASAPSDNTDNKPLICVHCSKSFTQQKALESHMKVHNDGVQCICERCDQSFVNSTALEKHLQFCRVQIVESEDADDEIINDAANNSKINGRSGKHECTKCNKSFTTKQKLFRHVWVHRKKAFDCEMCSKAFEIQNDLHLHRLKMHKGGSNHNCGACGKHFGTRQGLWEHIRAHDLENSMLHCDVCDKNFSSRQGYLIHLRKHSNERPYGCRFCMKRFRDGGTLRKHERTHTGERPHVCPLCKKAFNQKVVLREHLRCVHARNWKTDEDGSFNCTLCSETYSDRDELCAHFVKHSDQMAKLTKEMAKKASQSNINASNSEVTNGRVFKQETNSSQNAEVVEEPRSQKFIDVQKVLKVEYQESDLQCDLCGLFFKSRLELNSHIKVHI